MVNFLTVFSEIAIFALYIFTCLTLMKPRFSFVIRFSVYGFVILCSLVAAAIIAKSVNIMAAFTLLPLTAYLPFSLCVYILSEGGVFETASACSVGALTSMIAKTVHKVLFVLFENFFNKHRIDSFSPYDSELLTLIAVLIIAAIEAFAVCKFIRKSFGVCARSDLKNRLLVLIPTAITFMMIFFNLNTTVSYGFSVITLVTAVSLFIIVTRLFIYNAKVIEATNKEKRLSESLILQRKNFEQICRSVESGRQYRHDMRHHLKALSGMAQQNNSVEILKYIEELNESSELCAPKIFCKNPAINAILSEHINRAENIGCRTKYKICIPEDIPFELPDVCIILANALENALNACEKCPNDERFLDLLADFSDDRKLKISVSNSCADTIAIDNEGLPITASQTDGHGIGLQSVKKTVQKYNGFICCTCKNGEFQFCAEIFRDPNGASANGKNTDNVSKSSKALSAILTSLICVIVILNFSPSTASALSEMLSVDIKTISYSLGDNGLSIRYPQFGGNNSDSLNRATEDFIDEARSIFRQYVLQKYEGYAAEDAGYRIAANNRRYLSVRFYATINLGGSADYSRCITIDKQSGEEIALSDLFDENYDYIGKISAEVLSQMEFRVQYQEANYYIPGGIWSDDECFKEISPNQDFYINSFGKLVIVFDEYSVAPGSEGSPEFVMPDEIFRYGAEE